MRNDIAKPYPTGLSLNEMLANVIAFPSDVFAPSRTSKLEQGSLTGESFFLRWTVVVLSR